MLTGAFAFANNGNGDTNNSETKTTQTDNQTVVIQTTLEEKTDDKDLYCKIKIGSKEITCWNCDCEELAKELRQTRKVNK